MEPDPILQEVYQRKDQLNREVNGDVGQLFVRLRQMAEKRLQNKDQAAVIRKGARNK